MTVSCCGRFLWPRSCRQHHRDRRPGQFFGSRLLLANRMPPFLYRCPNTGYRVQGFVAEEVSDDQTYVSVTCIRCRQTHLVNPSSGRVVGGTTNARALIAPAAWRCWRRNSRAAVLIQIRVAGVGLLGGPGAAGSNRGDLLFVQSPSFPSPSF